jgi:hypothetical protein
MQTIAQVMGKFQAVAARTDDYGTCLVTGMSSFNKKTLVVNFDVFDIFIKMQIDMLAGVRLCLTNK